MQPSTRSKIVAALITVLLPAALGMAEAPRIALVIGNAAYAGDASLKNPVNDATDVAATLRKIGWNVTLLTDLDRRAFNRAVVNFRDALAKNEGSSALFYYAGHGMQADGANYLIPVNTDFETIDDIKNDAISISSITTAIEQARAGVSLLILDACRDNPFAKKMSRSLGGARGLTVVQGGGGTQGSAIMFSTSPGDVALDGSGRNGIFTEAFLKYLDSDLKIEDLFKKVTGEVRDLSAGAQTPWINASLSSDFYLKADAPRAALAGESAKTASATSQPELSTLKGKARIESVVEGQVFVGEDLIGQVGPNSPLIADNLATGTIDFRFAAPGLPDETKSMMITDKAYATVLFGNSSNPAGNTALVMKTIIQLRPLGLGEIRALDQASLGIDSLNMQERGRIFDNLKKQDALGICALNLIPFGVGSFVQGNTGYAIYQLVSPLALVGTFAFSAIVPHEGFSYADVGDVLILNFAVSYLSGFIVPWIYEAFRNEALQEVLNYIPGK
jgi:hypothetical protein